MFVGWIYLCGMDICVCVFIYNNNNSNNNNNNSLSKTNHIVKDRPRIINLNVCFGHNNLKHNMCEHNLFLFILLYLFIYIFYYYYLFNFFFFFFFFLRLNNHRFCSVFVLICVFIST